MTSFSDAAIIHYVTIESRIHMDLENIVSQNSLETV